MTKLYPSIQKASADEIPIVNSSGAVFKPYEYVCVYRGKNDDNDICYDSSKELLESEKARLTNAGMCVISEFLGGVGCIYELVN